MRNRLAVFGSRAGLGLALLLCCAALTMADDRVLVIGTDNAYPYHFLDSDGRPSGIAGDVIQEAARRTGIRIAWRHLPEGPTPALRAGAADLWPVKSIRSDGFHYTRPFLNNTYVWVQTNTVRRFERVVTANFNLGKEVVGRLAPQAELVVRATREQALVTLCRGEADGFLVEARALHSLVLRRPAECDGKAIETWGVDMPNYAQAIASTTAPEAIATADRLRAEIDRMTEDGTVSRILTRWAYFYSGDIEGIYRLEQADRNKKLSQAVVVLLALSAVGLLAAAVWLRRAKRAAVSAHTAKSKLVANLSHELRTPMNGMIGMVRLARATASEDERREYLRCALLSADTLMLLLNDIQDYSQIQGESLQMSSEPFQVSDLARQVSAAIAPLAREKGLSMICHVQPDVPDWVAGDTARIRQVLFNLLGNALKYTHRGSISVVVETTSSEGAAPELSFSVTDTGIGIPRSAQARIFEQAEGALAGTGLGLAVSRKLAVLMGGSLTFTSTAGEGSSFKLSVPLKPVHKPEMAPARRDCSEGPAELDILLAEDHPINQKLALAHLVKRGHRVDLAVNGKQAVEMALRKNYNAILMDIQMPEMDGIEATHRIREAERASGRRNWIIAMTAHVMAEDRDRCFEAGMDDFVSKPFKPDDLYHALDRSTPGVAGVR